MVNAGASLTTSSGNISFSANQQATPTAGNFRGVLVNGTVQTATGTVSVQGRGGNDAGGGQFGVYVNVGTVQATGTGGVNVFGAHQHYTSADG